jgi:hypothetical protein
MRVGERFKKMREAGAVSQVEVSQRTGVSTMGGTLRCPYWSATLNRASPAASYVFQNHDFLLDTTSFGSMF